MKTFSFISHSILKYICLFFYKYIQDNIILYYVISFLLDSKIVGMLCVIKKIEVTILAEIDVSGFLTYISFYNIKIFVLAVGAKIFVQRFFLNLFSVCY